MKRILWLLLIVVLLPPAAYLLTQGSVPSLRPAQAVEMLEENIGHALLIDVRPTEAYLARRVSGSISMPIDDLFSIHDREDLPPDLQDQPLILLCAGGIKSAAAARHLRQLGVEAFSVRGGILDWGRAWAAYPDSNYMRFELASGAQEQPSQEMTNGEQAAAAAALILIKPAYMLLTAALAFLLLRLQAADLRLLGASLLVFLIGEIACAVNYLILADDSYLAEHLHSTSMALAIGLAGFAIVAGLDSRWLHISKSDRPCTLMPLCGICARNSQLTCRLRRLIQLVCGAGIVLSLISLLSPFSQSAFNASIGPVTHYYVRPFVHQWFEIRYSPAIAMVFLGWALLDIQWKKDTDVSPTTWALFCGGLGYLSFGFIRMVLGMIFDHALVWATFWEEATELLFIASAIIILWIFRYTLIPQHSNQFKRIIAFLGMDNQA